MAPKQMKGSYQEEDNDSLSSPLSFKKTQENIYWK